LGIGTSGNTRTPIITDVKIRRHTTHSQLRSWR